MALRKTQSMLRREFRAEITELRKAIQLKCADCMGYFVDPYKPCTDEHCPLRKFYPTKGNISGRCLKREMVNLAQRRENHPNFMSEVSKFEAE